MTKLILFTLLFFPLFSHADFLDSFAGSYIIKSVKFNVSDSNSCYYLREQDISEGSVITITSKQYDPISATYYYLINFESSIFSNETRVYMSGIRDTRSSYESLSSETYSTNIASDESWFLLDMKRNYKFNPSKRSGDSVVTGLSYYTHFFQKATSDIYFYSFSTVEKAHSDKARELNSCNVNFVLEKK